MRIPLLAALATITMGCSANSGADGPGLPRAGKADDASTLLLGGTSYCPDAAPYDAFDKLTYTRSLGRFQALSFTASEGDQPDIYLTAADPSPGAHPRVWLEDASGNVVACNHNDEDSVRSDLETESLAKGGLYFLIIDNKLDADATFSLRVDCSQGDCAVTHSCGVAVPLSP
jgi:hypothetical protein